MRRWDAIAGSAIFFIAAPFMVAGVVPWLISRVRSLDFDPAFPLLVLAWAVAAVALAVLLQSFVRFALDGRGTPAPVAPTERLVVEGPYRHVRNPMYLSVIALALASGFIYGEAAVLIYAAIAAAFMIAFVRLYEEPTLRRRYGEEYDAYRAAVPGWIPRLTPWRGSTSAPHLNADQ